MVIPRIYLLRLHRKESSFDLIVGWKQKDRVMLLAKGNVMEGFKYYNLKCLKQNS